MQSQPEFNTSPSLNTAELFQLFSNSIKGGIARTIARETLKEHQNDQDYATRVAERYLSSRKNMSDRNAKNNIKQMVVGRLNERRKNLITSLLAEQDDAILTDKIGLSAQLQSLNTIGQYAFDQLKNEGWYDGRTIDYNRHVLALFVMYLIKNSQAQSLTLVTGDMDGLKNLNNINPQLGDLGILTVFGASRALANHHNGVNFAPNKAGGDDTLAIFVDLPPEAAAKLDEELDTILKTIISSQDDIFNAWQQGQVILDKENSIILSFHSTGESKSLSPEQVRQYRIRQANKAINPGLTHLTYAIQLDNLRKVWNETHDTKAVLNIFFDEWNQKHTEIDEAKASKKNEL